MINHRIKLVWGNPVAVTEHWLLWLFGVYQRNSKSRSIGLVISLRGLLCWGAGAALTAYIAATSLWFFWQSDRLQNTVTYADALLLPVRWPHIREALGRAMIREGMDDFRKKRWADGEMKLRVGLGRAPHDLEARTELARFYALINQRSQAQRILSDELDHGYPGRPYLEMLFDLAAGGEDHEFIIATCDRFEKGRPEERSWLVAQKLRALLGAGRADEALQLARAEGPGASATVDEAQVLALLALGRGEEAVQFLAAWRERPGANPVQVLRLQVQACATARRFAEMDAALAELQWLAPTDPRVYIIGVVQDSLAGRDREAARLLEVYFARFAATPDFLALAAGELMQAPSPALLQRCAREAAEHGFPIRPYLLLLAQRQVQLADWAGAARTLGELEPQMKNPRPTEFFTYQWLQRLVAATHPDEGLQTPLLTLLQGLPLSAAIYRQTVETLLAAGRLETAAKALELAHRPYATNLRLAALRVRVRQELEAKALQMARTAPAAPARAGARGPKEQDFFAQIADLTAAGRWEPAALAVRELLRAKPGWLERREPEVLEWQIRIAARTGDELELAGAAQRYLNGDLGRAARMLALAVDFHPQSPAAGSLLLQELLRRYPEYKPALRVQEKWQARQLSSAL